MNTVPLTWLVALTLLASCHWVHAETLPVFDINYGAIESDHILEGTLFPDGTLEVRKVHKGALQLPAKCNLSNGDYEFSSFAEIMKSDAPKSCVAFVQSPTDQGEYPLAMGTAGLVMISQADKVYGWLPSWEQHGGAAIGPHPTWTPLSFFNDLNRSMQVAESLAERLAAPRGAARTRELVRVVESETVWPSPESRGPPRLYAKPGYIFHKVVGGLLRPNVQEETALAELMNGATSEKQRSLFLALVASIKPSSALFNAVLPWVELTAPDLTRREAIPALLACDPYRGAGVLSQFLRIDDPHLDALITALASSGWSRKANVRHLSVIAPLMKLGRQVLVQGKSRSSDVPNRSWAILSLIQSYIHPDLLPLLFEWKDTLGIGTSAQALSNLRSVLAVSNEPLPEDDMRDWWGKNQTLLQQTYDLSKPSEIDSWLREWWSHNDPLTRRVMLYQWDFQPRILEGELLERCAGPNAEAAKLLLSELWQRKRLSPSTHKEIVRRYVKMKTIMEPNRYTTEAIPGEVRILSEKLFPFPDEAYVRYAGELAADREPVPVIQDRQSGGGQSLSRQGPLVFYSTSGRGDVSVKGIVEVWETDHQASPPKDLWRLRWRVTQTYREKVVEVEAEQD